MYIGIVFNYQHKIVGRYNSKLSEITYIYISLAQYFYFFVTKT